MLRWFTRTTGNKRSKQRDTLNYSFRPSFESLEDRLYLSASTYTNGLGKTVQVSALPTATALKASTAAVAIQQNLPPLVTVTGLVTLSVDGLGTNDPAGGIIQVEKPSASATVRGAYLAAASTGFSNYTLVNGDVTVDGNPVAWDTTVSPVSSSIGSSNSWADVTSLVKPKLDAAAAGRVDFLVAEPNNTNSIDGEILAVVFDDPLQPTPNTIILLFGAQNVAGDTFNVLLASPLDKTDPNLALEMSLGISYSSQPAGQYSQVDVNGQRLTTSAGGQDDGQSENGALLTVGGLDDSPANPADPLATDTNGPRYDDELYDLLPFVNTGDSTITVATVNPSNDDNIFFAAFNLKSTVAIVGEGIVLAPSSQDVNVGETASVTATLQDDVGNPVANRTVSFEVTSGPNAGQTGSTLTDSNGKATFSYSSALTGSDTVVARFVDNQEQTQTSATSSTINWLQSNSPPVATDDSATTNQSTAVNIDVLSNDSDPDGSIDPTSVEIVDAAGSGTTSINPTTGAVTYTPAATFSGGDSFTYRVKDNLGAFSNVATVNITVVAAPQGPVANDDSATTQKNTCVTINVLANDTDSSGTIRPSCVTIVSNPKYGKVKVDSRTGAVTYTPNKNYMGPDCFTYKVKDSNGTYSNVAKVSLTVTAPNCPPTARDDSATTCKNAPVTINVLANDKDKDGSIDPTSVVICKAPKHGTTCVNPNTGAITYTPASNYCGSDTFTYKVKDNQGAYSNVATVCVTITKPNQAPQANNDSVSGKKNKSIVVKVVANDRDPDGLLDLKSLCVVGKPCHGTVKIDANGTITYTPDRNYCGIDIFTYKVKDKAGLWSNVATVCLTVKS